MPDQPKIDPDKVAKYHQAVLRVRQGGRPEMAARYAEALIDAAREAVEVLAELGRDGVSGEEVDSGDVIYDCGYCGTGAAEWREISHEITCSVGEVTIALLALEALLPIQDTALEGIVQDAVASNQEETEDG